MEKRGEKMKSKVKKEYVSPKYETLEFSPWDTISTSGDEVEKVFGPDDCGKDMF